MHVSQNYERLHVEEENVYIDLIGDSWSYLYTEILIYIAPQYQGIQKTIRKTPANASRDQFRNGHFPNAQNPCPSDACKKQITKKRA
jgi:hypothetical protein